MFIFDVFFDVHLDVVECVNGQEFEANLDCFLLFPLL